MLEFRCFKDLAFAKKTGAASGRFMYDFDNIASAVSANLKNLAR